VPGVRLLWRRIHANADDLLALMPNADIRMQKATFGL
jgi:hypothetical protein